MLLVEVDNIASNLMSSVEKYCAVCEVESNLKACSGCGEIYYCSVEHQKQDWKQHKGNCKPFRVSLNGNLIQFQFTKLIT